MTNIKCLIIGVGNMGNSFANTLLQAKIINPESLFLCDQNTEKLSEFEKKGCIISQNAEELIPEATLIFLAVKPQNAQELLSKWNPYFSENKVIISMMAGISIETIQKHSGVQKIIRIMPNTPMLVEKGLLGYFFTKNFSKTEQKEYSNILQKLSESVECSSEEQINSITALSGSGPAYYFRLMEMMQEQAISFGFSEKDAKRISLQTLIGSGELAKKSNEDFSVLRQKVTSKGGTTEAALTYFEKNNLENIWKTGMQKAKKRAEELSEK